MNMNVTIMSMMMIHQQHWFHFFSQECGMVIMKNTMMKKKVTMKTSMMMRKVMVMIPLLALSLQRLERLLQLLLCDLLQVGQLLNLSSITTMIDYQDIDQDLFLIILPLLFLIKVQI